MILLTNFSNCRSVLVSGLFSLYSGCSVHQFSSKLNPFRDLSKALIFLRNALTILQLITVDDVHAKYKSSILYHLSVVLRLKGSLGDAREACEEALRLSQESGSKSVYARCLSSLADIYRELGESEARETITVRFVFRGCV